MVPAVAEEAAARGPAVPAVAEVQEEAAEPVEGVSLRCSTSRSSCSRT